MEVCYLQIAVIDEALVVLRDAATHAVKTHCDFGRSACPQYGAVLAVVSDMPDASRGLDERLIAVVVKIGDKHIFTYRGNLRVLVQFIRDVCRVRAALEGCFAVADWVILIIVTVVGINGSDSVCQLVAGVVSIRDNIFKHKGRSSLGDSGATTCGVVGIVKLGDDVGRSGVTDLKELVVGVILPTGGQAIGVDERGLEVGTRQVRPNEFSSVTLRGR